MKKLFMFIVFVLTLAGVCHSFWIWTPETGRFINPKYAVKDSPKEQFEWAMEFYKAGDYKRALSEFRKLYRIYPDSMYASQSGLYEGKSQEGLGNYWQAFKAYQKMIEKYPYSESVPVAIERSFKIGEMFLEGKKIKRLGLEIFPSADETIQIFEKVVKNAPFGPYGAKAQFNLGVAYSRARRFAESGEAFLKVIDNYPESPLAGEARIQIAKSSQMDSLRPKYDQTSTKKAIQEFEEILKLGSQPEIVEKAQQSLTALKEKKAESLYLIAQFYEKRRSVNGAKIYYKQILKNYADTNIAEKAKQRMTEIFLSGKSLGETGWEQ